MESRLNAAVCEPPSPNRVMRVFRTRTRIRIRSRVPPMLFLFLVLAQLALFWCALNAALHARIDFKAFYTAGHLVSQGRGPEIASYDAQQQAQTTLFGADSRTLPFLYPACAALIFVPFALLPYRAAYFLFTGLNCALLVLAVHLLVDRVASLRSLPWSVRYGFAVALLPLSEVLIQGQISILLLLLYVVFERLLRQGNPGWRVWCWPRL